MLVIHALFLAYLDAQERLNDWPPLGGTTHCRAILLQVCVGMEVLSFFCRAYYIRWCSLSPCRHTPKSSQES